MVSSLICIFTFALPVAVDGFTIQNESIDEALHTNDLLWQGMDVDEEDLAAVHVFGQSTNAADKRECGPGNTLIVGPFDSGTNLMKMLVQRNFPSVVFPCSCAESGPRFWKHSNSGPQAFRDAVQRSGLNPESTKVIVLLRSPLSQAVSWHKAPYDLSMCAIRLYNSWGMGCSAHIAASVDMCRPRPPFGMSSYRDNTQIVSFHSTMDIYNSYVRQYMDLASSGWFSGVHIVTYEEILYHPHAVIEELARFLEAPMPENIDICSAPAKDHGNAHGRDLALQNYHIRPWLRLIGSLSVRTLCSLIDMDLIQNLTEGKGFVAEVAGEALPYAHDCRDQAM